MKGRRGKVLDKAVVFGAGNIGRSFIGSIFSSNGLEVVFVDASRPLVEELNRRRGYRIIIKKNGEPDREIVVSGISAVHSSDEEGIIRHLAECRICATSVGQGALPRVIPVLAGAVKERIRLNAAPLDIIIAENIRGGAGFFRSIFREEGLGGDEAGLIETSIGKMVPIMTEKDLAEDPLVLHAEEYNTLILDRNGFKNPVPAFPEIKAVGNIAAWVDRKLFIHNLGHAAAAYFGYSEFPDRDLIADVLDDRGIREKVRGVMAESAAALLAEYPEEFTEKDLSGHIDDLIRRFRNKALGDTVFRVGRDLKRKLGRDDRILGAARLCVKHGLPRERIISVFYAALRFGAVDLNGRPFDGDREFLGSFERAGMRKALTVLCGLDPVEDGGLIGEISVWNGGF